MSSNWSRRWPMEPSSAPELALDLGHARDQVVLGRPVVDPALDVGPQRRPLIRQLLGLVGAEGEDHQADGADCGEEAQVGQGGAEGPVDVAVLELRHHRVEQEDDGAGDDQRGPDDPYPPGNDAEDEDDGGQPDHGPGQRTGPPDAVEGLLRWRSHHRHVLHGPRPPAPSCCPGEPICYYGLDAGHRVGPGPRPRRSARRGTRPPGPRARLTPSSTSPTTASTGTPAGGGQLGHPTDDLAVEGLLVEEALAGDHQVGPLDAVGQVELVGHEVEARDEGGADGGQAPGEAPGRSAPHERPDVDAVVALVHLGQALQAPAEQLDLGGRRPLLGAEDPGRLEERGCARRRPPPPRRPGAGPAARGPAPRPSPPSTVAEPPTATITRRHPSSTAAPISSPVP